jgi:hypothetical protein
LGFLERTLDSKFNPLIYLGRRGTFGLSGLVNKFNAEAKLLSDLVSRFAGFVRSRRLITFLRTISGQQEVTRYLPDFVSRRRGH